MSLNDFNAKIEAIKAIPDSQTVVPNMPVAIALQEAEDLYQWCQADKEGLEKVGLDWKIVTDLPLRTGACRHAQSSWMKDYQTQEDAEKEWKNRSAEAFNLRDELVHEFFHAFYNHPDLARRVQTIAEGGSNADMLQDLSDLSVLGLANLALLASVKVDEAKLDLARQTADELSEVLAKANGERQNFNEAKKTRDKAYGLMKQAVDEIRRHGQYLFWRDEARKKGYISKYFKAQKSDKQPKETKKV